MFLLVVLSLIFAGLGLLGLCYAIVVYRRYRYVEDVPTSTIRGAAAGLTEVKGRVVAAEEPFLSPFQEQASVLCHYAFYGRTPQEESWAPPRDTGTLGVPFYVEDETGRMLVRPEGAEMGLLCHLTELTMEEDRIEEVSPAVVERFQERKQNGSLPDLGGDRAAVANSVYSLRQDEPDSNMGPPRGAEARLEEGDEVYVLGSAQPRKTETDPHDDTAPDEHNLFIGKTPESDGVFSWWLKVIPVFTAGYGSIFEIYAGREEDLAAERTREMWTQMGKGLLFFVIGLTALLLLILVSFGD